ncbi:hypothetical protein [Erwinia rhapontici]|nr:hypothetical protein [Erwinia rhapontici]
MLMHARSEVEHELVYKPFQGNLSREEHMILDEINGLVLAGEAKPSWKREGLVVQSFFVDYESRETSAGWKQHLCYWVRFSSRQAISFSVREAIDTILKFEADSL